MRLVNRDYDISVMFEENKIEVFYVENRICFTNMVRDFWLQHEGREGSWILSEVDENIAISKSAEVIINPLTVDCNDRKIIKVLYQDLVRVLQDNYLDTYTEINSALVSLLSRITDEQPYPLEINLEASIADIFKIYDLRFSTEDTDLCEMLVSYMKIWHRVAHVKFFVFVNLKSYLTEEQYEAFCQETFYEKLNILLIESRYSDEKKNDFEKIKIIDEDLCIIDL
jgi:CRISPR-associated protein Csn2